MTEEKEAKEVKGTISYNGGSKRFYRYSVKADDGIVGSLYLPQDIDKIPDKIVLEKES